LPDLWEILKDVLLDALKTLPFCLETPHEKLEEYAEEIRLVRGLCE
jgi:endonuclease IV